MPRYAAFSRSGETVIRESALNPQFWRRAFVEFGPVTLNSWLWWGVQEEPVFGVSVGLRNDF